MLIRLVVPKPHILKALLRRRRLAGRRTVAPITQHGASRPHPLEALRRVKTLPGRRRVAAQYGRACRYVLRVRGQRLHATRHGRRCPTPPTYKRAPVRVERLPRDGEVFDLSRIAPGIRGRPGRCRQVPPRPCALLFRRRRRQVHSAVVDHCLTQQSISIAGAQCEMRLFGHGSSPAGRLGQPMSQSRVRLPLSLYSPVSWLLALRMLRDDDALDPTVSTLSKPGWETSLVATFSSCEVSCILVPTGRRAKGLRMGIAGGSLLARQ